MCVCVTCPSLPFPCCLKEMRRRKERGASDKILYLCGQLMVRRFKKLQLSENPSHHFTNTSPRCASSLPLRYWRSSRPMQPPQTTRRLLLPTRLRAGATGPRRRRRRRRRRQRRQLLRQPLPPPQPPRPPRLNLLRQRHQRRTRPHRRSSFLARRGPRVIRRFQLPGGHSTSATGYNAS